MQRVFDATAHLERSGAMPQVRALEEECVLQVLHADTIAAATERYLKYMPLINPWRFIFAVPKGISLNGLINRKFSKTATSISLFGDSEVLFLDARTLSEKSSDGVNLLAIDYSIGLDTQAASYLRRLTQGERSDGLPEDVAEVIAFIAEGHINIDPLPYVLENIVSLEDRKTLGAFEATLEAYAHLRSIDAGLFQRCGVVRSRHSADRHAREVAALKHTLLHAPEMKAVARELCVFQLTKKAILLKSVLIQWESPQKSLHAKIEKLLAFMHVKLGKVSQRELVLASTYFEQHQNLLFFRKIQTGKPFEKLIKEINGMSWDLAHLRGMERIGTFEPFDFARHTVPGFLTFDEGLADVLRTNSLRVFAVRQDGERPYTIPASPRFGHGTEEFDAALEKRFYSDIARQERANRSRLTNGELTVLISSLESELRSYCSLT